MNPNETLTPREYECLDLTAKGKTLREICSIMKASKTSVEQTRSRIKQKLDIYTVAGLAVYAYKHGFGLADNAKLTRAISEAAALTPELIEAAGKWAAERSREQR